MVKKFDMSAAQKRAVEKALARLEMRKQRQAERVRNKHIATRSRRQKEQREAKAARIRPKRQSPAEIQKLALPGWQVLIARMDPDGWHTFGQLRALTPEYSAGTIKGYALNRMPKDGWLEKAGNPDFKEDPHNCVATMASGMMLYRMTDKAREKRQEWREALTGTI